MISTHGHVHIQNGSRCVWPQGQFYAWLGYEEKKGKKKHCPMMIRDNRPVCQNLAESPDSSNSTLLDGGAQSGECWSARAGVESGDYWGMGVQSG